VPLFRMLAESSIVLVPGPPFPLARFVATGCGPLVCLAASLFLRYCLRCSPAADSPFLRPWSIALPQAVWIFA